MVDNTNKHHTFLLFTAVFISTSLACFSLSTGLPRAPQDGEPEKMEVEEVIGPGSFHFPDPTVGMAELTSYKATLTRSFKGTKDGKDIEWSSTHVLISTKQPTARILTIVTTPEPGEGEPILLAEMNGTAFQLGSDGSCVTSFLDPTNSLIDRSDPIASITGVIGAEEAGHETVNGMEADHYRFDERALGDKNIKSNGELWVASQGGYLVRYLLTTTGDEDYFGEKTKGSLSIEYELTEVNQLAELLAPEGCPQGIIDAPQLADATIITNVPGLLEYESASSVAEATAFYQEQLSSMGWEPQGDPDLRDTFTFLNYIKGEQQLSVIITQNENKIIIQNILSENPHVPPLIIQ